jgi:uncharacterized protein (DUF433 family)
MKMELAGYPRISIDTDVCGGRPVVAGTRLRVSDILEMLAGGSDTQEIVTDFPYVTVDDVRACLAYAAGVTDHPVVIAAE